MNPAFIFAATLALAPADRMQLADKMFARGLYSEAAREYRAIGRTKTVSADDLAFRIAECEYALGNTQAAESAYAALLPKDNLPKAVRAVVLYRLACARNDAALYLECERADPDGRYAVYARLRRALLLSKSPDPVKRREATGLFFELSTSDVPSVAEESLYAAAALAYGDKRWSEAAILFGRLIKKYPVGARAKSSRVPLAWSAYLAGRHSDCLVACGKGGEDDLDYLRGAAMMAMDNHVEGLSALRHYLETRPAGRYRAAAEVPVRRAEFNEAVKRGDRPAAVQAARLAAAASGSAADALRLAWAHEKAGAVSEARAEYRRIAATWPEDPAAGEALFANALADLREQRWSTGELALDELLRRFPEFPRRSEALYWRGVAALRLKHEVEGVERLKAALKAGLPLDLTREAKLMLADAEARAGNVEAAAEKYAEIMLTGAADRMSAARLASVVKLLAQTKRFKAALVGARALASRTSEPTFAQQAAAREGEALEALGRFDEAVAAYRRALRQKAETDEAAAAALALGILEYRKGELDAAEKTLADAVARNSGAAGIKARAQAYRNLARVCRAKGDEKKAAGYETVVKELFGE